ncbi:hypothetical protein DAI22_01g351200 [Oryza sativa Japonica Group]|nr:hypothetical protein DAI22_01g351200 [Oryza sativa Japonica Group]KAF2952656.1 hypothetical protein DAI22_01g351200 [Oryza sativa Japonica Group]
MNPIIWARRRPTKSRPSRSGGQMRLPGGGVGEADQPMETSVVGVWGFGWARDRLKQQCGYRMAEIITAFCQIGVTNKVAVSVAAGARK